MSSWKLATFLIDLHPQKANFLLTLRCLRDWWASSAVSLAVRVERTVTSGRYVWRSKRSLKIKDQLSHLEDIFDDSIDWCWIVLRIGEHCRCGVEYCDWIGWRGKGEIEEKKKEEEKKLTTNVFGHYWKNLVWMKNEEILHAKILEKAAKTYVSYK